MSQTTIIIQVKTTPQAVAAACKSALGMGTNPEAERVIDLFTRNSSEPSNGFIRIAVEDFFLPHLEAAMASVGNETEDFKLISIERNGQARFVTGTNPEGNEEVLGCVGTLPIDRESWGEYA